MTKIITRRYRVLPTEVLDKGSDILLKIHVHERNEDHDNAGTKRQRMLVLNSLERRILAKLNCEVSRIQYGPVPELS